MTLFAGAASASLAPAKPLQLFGYPHVRRVTDHVHDPILANALVLANDGARAVVVSLDLLMLEPPFARDLRTAVAAAARTDETRVFIGCTHTHSAPVTGAILGWSGDVAMPQPDPEYLALVRRQTIAAVSTAAGALEPAGLGWTTADITGIGTNRLDPDGPADREAGVMAVHRADGSPLALLLTVAMHPTVLHEDSLAISADFPGYARQHLREAWGDGLTVVHLTAPCGNQSPRYVVQGQTFVEAQRLGTILGLGVQQAVEALPPDAASADPVLGGTIATVDLPRQQLVDLDTAQAGLAEAQARLDGVRAAGAPHGPVRTAECAVFGAEGSVEMARASADGRLDAWLATARPAVQALRLGPATLAGLPGECFVEYGLAIKKHAPGRLFPVSLVNGHLQGYVVTAAAALAGGYEASNSLYAPAAGDRLVRAAADLFDTLNSN